MIKNFSLKQNKEWIILVLILCVAFVLYNYTNFFGTNWFFHPDDHEYYVIGKNLFNYKSFSYNEPLNELFEYPVFTPTGATAVGNQVVPVRALGMYVLVAICNVISPGAIFFVIPLITILGMIYLYRLIVLISNKLVAIFSVFITSLSFPFIYWSNMIFPIIPAFVFFIIGLYYLYRLLEDKEPKLKHYILIAIFFAFALWLRYEYTFFLIFLIPVFIIYRRKISLKMALISAILFFLIISPIFVINNSLYGSPFVVGYIYKNPDLIGDSYATSYVNEEEESVNLVTELNKIYHRFLGQTTHPDKERILRNLYDWIINIYPLILVFALLGLFSIILKWKRSYVILILLLFISLYWAYHNSGGILWGYRKKWLASSYIRYYPIIYATIFIFASLFLDKLKKVFENKKIYIFVLMIAFTVFGFKTSHYLTSGPYNLVATTNIKIEKYKINEVANSFPENSIFVGQFNGKYIVDRKVLNPRMIPEYIRIDTTVQYLKKLLNLDYQVFVFEEPLHKSTFLNLANVLDNDNSFTVIPKDVEGYTIYEIKLKRI